MSATPLMTERVRIEGPPETPTASVLGDSGWVLVHSRRDPVREANALLSDFSDPLPSSLVVVGLGLGYLVDALAARGWTGRLLALEPEPGLVPALLARPLCADWSRSGRLRVVTGPDYRQTAETLAELGLSAPRPLVHPLLARTHADQTRRAFAVLARAANGVRANEEAKKRQSSLCLRNTLSNLRLLSRESDVTALDGIMQKVPAIVVGAGPSLDRQLDQLRDAQSNALIITVDTALRPLLAAGVTPHLVVSVDPSTINATHLLELPGAGATWLVAETSIDPHAMSAFRDRIFAFRVGTRHPWPWLIANGCDCGSLRAWGSVLTTAFDLAARMGASPIALAGADLAYTGDQPYCRGTTFEQVWRRAEDWGTPLDAQWTANLSSWTRVDEAGVAGAVCRTAPHLVSFKDWIAEQALALAPLRIVNTTGAGILVGSHIEQRSLDVLAAGWTQVDVRDRIAAAWAQPTRGRQSLPTLLETFEAGQPDTEPARTTWEQATGDQLDAKTVSALLGRPARGDDGACLSERYEVAALELPAAPAPPTADEITLQAIRATLPAQASLITVELTGREASPHAMAKEALALAGDDGTVALLDRSNLPLGDWSRQVARDLVREDPSLSVEFPWYMDFQRRMAVVRRAPGRSPDVTRADAFKYGDANRAAARDIVEILVHRFSPASIADVGPGDGAWLDAFRDGGVPDARGIATADAVAVGSEALAWRADLCLCLGVVDQLGVNDAMNVIARCCATSDLVVFAAMDPGRGHNDVALPRTLGWWAECFLREGYVLSDELRPAIEARWPQARGLHDFLVCFRRVMSRAEAQAWPLQAPFAQAVTALADRIDVLRTRITAEQIERQRIAQAALRPVAPDIPMVRMTLPPERLHREPGGVFLFRFRTRAARRWIAQGDAASFQVLDGDVPLALSAGALSEAAPGHCAIDRDELRFQPVTPCDPRLSGTRVSVVVPEDVAGAEALPLDLIVRHGL